MGVGAEPGAGVCWAVAEAAGGGNEKARLHGFCGVELASCWVVVASTFATWGVLEWGAGVECWNAGCWGAGVGWAKAKKGGGVRPIWKGRTALPACG